MTTLVKQGNGYDYPTNWFEVRALGGEDVCRELVTLVIEARKTGNGRCDLYDATSGELLRLTQHIGSDGLILGWGDLDGDSYAVVNDEGYLMGDLSVPIPAVKDIESATGCTVTIHDRELIAR